MPEPPTSPRGEPIRPEGPNAVLDAGVAELYAAFRRRTLSEQGPDICTACCASPEARDRIARASPEAVCFEDLGAFHAAAKGGGAAQDMAFLLPRTMEALSRGRAPGAVGLFALFAVDFPPMWPRLSERERDAVRRFLRALMRWRLSLGPREACDYGPMDVLEMAASGGFDVDPVLDVLAHPPPTDATTDALIALILHHAPLWQDGRGLYRVPGLVAQHVAARLRAIIASPNTVARLERAALADGDPPRASRASLAHQIAEHEAARWEG